MSWEEFENCFIDVTGGNPKIKRSDYLEIGKIPIIDQGKQEIGGYTNDSNLSYKGEIPCIIFGDHSKIFKYIDYPFALGADGVKVLNPKSGLLAKYGYYFLQTIELPPTGYERNFKYLKRVKIPLPDLHTQQQIVAVLDKAQSLIRKREQSIQLLDELLNATFLDMFGDPVLNEKGWEKKPLSQLVRKNSNISYGIVKSGDDIKSDGVPIVRPVDLTADIVNSVGLKHTSKKISNQYKRTILNGDELLLSVRGNVGLISKASLDLKEANVTRGIVPLAFSDVIETEFFFWLLRTKGMLETMKKEARGIALKQLNIKELKFLKLINPNRKLKEEFFTRITKIASLKNDKVYIGSLEYEKLFKSLLQDAFAGNLKLKNDTIAVQSKLSDLRWFENQLSEIIDNSPAKQLQKQLKQINFKNSAFESLKDVREQFDKLKIPRPYIDEISNLRKQLDQWKVPDLKLLKSQEIFERLENQGLIKKVTDNREFRLKSFDEFVKAEEERKLQERLVKENDPVLRFIGEQKIGRFTLSNYQVNIARAIYELFGKSEFDLEAIKQGMAEQYGVTIHLAPLRKDVYRLFEEFIHQHLNGLFAFDDMRTEMKNLLFNPSFELLQDFVEEGLKKKTIKQVYLKDVRDFEDNKWHPSNVLDYTSSIEKYLREKSNRIYLQLKPLEDED